MLEHSMPRVTTRVNTGFLASGVQSGAQAVSDINQSLVYLFRQPQTATVEYRKRYKTSDKVLCAADLLFDDCNKITCNL